MRSMKENVEIAAFSPMTKYNYLDCVFISLLGLCGRKLSLAEVGEKVVSEQARLASLEPRTTNHLRCPSTR